MPRNYGFGGLGFTQKQKKQARRAARTGTLNEFFGTVDPGSAEEYGRRIEGRSGSTRQQKGAWRAQRFGNDFSLDAINASRTEPTGAIVEGPSSSGPTQAGGPVRTMDQLLEDYGYGGPSVQAAQQFVSQAANTLANGPAMPTFEELYSSFRDVAEDETNRQAGQLRESFGSRGARYGSDVLSAEGDLRAQAGRNINQQAAEYGLNLANAGTARLGALGNLAGLDINAREAALQKMYLDAMRLTAPPPLLAGGISTAPQYGGVDNVVTA